MVDAKENKPLREAGHEGQGQHGCLCLDARNSNIQWTWVAQPSAGYPIRCVRIDERGHGVVGAGAAALCFLEVGHGEEKRSEGGGGWRVRCAREAGDSKEAAGWGSNDGRTGSLKAWLT